MAFLLAETSLTYQENCFDTEEAAVCAHYVLKKFRIPETNWVQRLADIVECTEDKYTIAYPCMSEGGQGLIGPQLYAVSLLQRSQEGPHQLPGERAG